MGSASVSGSGQHEQAWRFPFDGINLTILVLTFFLFPDSRWFPLYGNIKAGSSCWLAPAPDPLPVLASPREALGESHDIDLPMAVYTQHSLSHIRCRLKNTQTRNQSLATGNSPF
jgi:hypothetical protein